MTIRAERCITAHRTCGTFRPNERALGAPGTPGSHDCHDDHPVGAPGRAGRPDAAHRDHHQRRPRAGVRTAAGPVGQRRAGAPGAGRPRLAGAGPPGAGHGAARRGPVLARLAQLGLHAGRHGDAGQRRRRGARAPRRHLLRGRRAAPLPAPPRGRRLRERRRAPPGLDHGAVVRAGAGPRARQGRGRPRQRVRAGRAPAGHVHDVRPGRRPGARDAGTRPARVPGPGRRWRSPRPCAAWAVWR